MKTYALIDALKALYDTPVRGYHSKRKRQRKKSRRQTPFNVLMRKPTISKFGVTGASIWQTSEIHGLNF